MISLLISALIFSALGGAVNSSLANAVSTDAGIIYGGRCNGTSDAAYFKSIPYAQPPTGDLRFAPPKPYSGKYPGGSLMATSAAPGCIQFGNLFAVSGTTSEDCLYLDIWAPSNAAKDSALPVKVWIYGGAENAGGISYPLYDGCNLAQDDAILVTINYRLGPLGFLSLHGAGIQGNQGIQDLLLGLEWIQSNIAAFGGDPAKVLLFGQSAGATNTFVIATLPQAPKLIKAAITESGGGRDLELNATSQSLGEAYAKNLSCGHEDSGCLKGKSVSDLVTSFAHLPTLNSGIGIDGAIGIGNAQTSQFAPYLDGEIIPTQPSEQGVRVPTIFGSNAAEGTLFALAQYATNPQGPVGATAADYTTFLQNSFGSAASLVEQHYPLSLFNSTPYPVFFAISQVLTESTYTCSAYRGLNRAVQKGIPVWTYLYDHAPSCQWLSFVPEETLSLVGATHTAEIPLVFGNLANLPSPNGTCNSTAQEYDISAFLKKAWTAMASNGSPSTSDFHWPRYENSSQSLGIKIDNFTTAGVVDYSSCKLWDQINNNFLKGPNSTATNSTGAPTPTPLSTSTGGASVFFINSLSWIMPSLAVGAFILL